MSDEFETFKNSIRSITSQDFNTAFTLCGKIINYTSNMEYCDVEVEMNGGKHVFTNVPAHGYPVKDSTGILHFHNGNLEQPVCDCAYRMNPPNNTLREYYTNDCYNWVDNGNFMFKTEGYRTAPGKTLELVNESNTIGTEESVILRENGDYIEFTVDLKDCDTEYFKFQCYYKGNGELKVECLNASTLTPIQNLPYTVSFDYKVWVSPYGRNGWAFNKEVYPHLTRDGNLNEKIIIRLTNISDDVEEMEYNNEVIDEKGHIIEGISKDSIRVKSAHSMLVDGLLVYCECDDNRYYNSVNDMIKQYSL